MCKKQGCIFWKNDNSPYYESWSWGNGAENKVPLLNKSSLKLELEVWSVLVFWTGASQSQLLSIQSTDPGTLDNLNFFLKALNLRDF